MTGDYLQSNYLKACFPPCWLSQTEIGLKKNTKLQRVFCRFSLSFLFEAQSFRYKTAKKSLKEGTTAKRKEVYNRDCNL
jgi:hypothetical protein